jgi:outer membrane protein OmpA-like peptidoglycan-associated protein
MMNRFAITLAMLLVTALSVTAQPVPRVETGLNYSYIRYQGDTFAPTYHANGGNFQLVLNVSNRIAVVGDFGGYQSGGLSAFGFNSTLVNYLAGPRVWFGQKRLRPYVQALFGGAWENAYIVGPLNTPGPWLTGSTSAFALLAGGGLDIRLGRHVALKAAEASYFYTRLPNPAYIGEHLTNNVRLSAGLSLLFGGEKPAPPPPPKPAMKTCPDGSTVPAGSPCPKLPLNVGISGARAQMCQGETMSLASNLSANHSGVAFQWTVNGQPAGQGATFSFGGSSIAPGTYRVGVTASGEAYSAATSDTTIAVLEKRAPTGSVEAAPAEVKAGERATLSARFAGQCCDPISAPTFTASEGSISGNQFDSSGVSFDAADHSEQRRVVTIVAKVTDSCNNEGTAKASVTVIQQATAAPVRLPDVLFPSGSSRVNNCGKRVLLEQLKTYFERDPAGKAVLVGHTATNETASKLAEDRARNAAAVITAGSGICLSIPPDQVLVSAPGSEQKGVDFKPNFCGASVLEQRGSAINAGDPMAQYRRVEVWFVPSGATPPASLGDYRPAGALKISGCPR